jgi:phage terminase small subunit
MMNNQKKYDLDEQCELSLELLVLLRWLCEHEIEALKKLVDKAVKEGFKGAIATEFNNNQQLSSSIHHSILDFLDIVDTLLAESMTEHSLKTAQQKNLLPALHQVDTKSYDTGSLQHSLDKTITYLEDHPNTNPKEHLYKELLKRWKPANKKMHH